LPLQATILLQVRARSLCHLLQLINHGNRKVASARLAVEIVFLTERINSSRIRSAHALCSLTTPLFLAQHTTASHHFPAVSYQFFKESHAHKKVREVTANNSFCNTAVLKMGRLAPQGTTPSVERATGD
jgi:hypothetical protein